MAVELNGARVLLTGASGGIGNAIARALHERGASVAISGRRADALEALKAELGGDRVDVIPADLAERADVDALPGRAGTVDVLVANAALPGSGRLDDYGQEEIDRAIDVNLRAPIHLSRVLLPGMLERGRGHIVLVSSLSGKIAAGGGSIYSATKFGLRGFGLSLYDELHGAPVGATVVYPGFISDAGMFAETSMKLPPGVGTKSPEQVAAGVIDGIENDRPEVEVAPLGLRLSAKLAGVAPGTVAAISRKLGSSEFAEELAEAQREKR